MLQVLAIVHVQHSLNNIYYQKMSMKEENVSRPILLQAHSIFILGDILAYMAYNASGIMQALFDPLMSLIV